MRWLLIVNGPPGSGKTTLAGSLSIALGLPLFSKDAVKETLLDALGFADRAESRRIGAASGEVLWTLVRDCPTPVIIDSWLAPSIRDMVREGVTRGAIDRVVEVWCSCAPQENMRRYAERRRHPGHFDEALLPDFHAVLDTAEPLALGPVIRVPTDDLVDVGRLIAQVNAAVSA